MRFRLVMCKVGYTELRFNIYIVPIQISLYIYIYIYIYGLGRFGDRAFSLEYSA